MNISSSTFWFNMNETLLTIDSFSYITSMFVLFANLSIGRDSNVWIWLKLCQIIYPTAFSVRHQWLVIVFIVLFHALIWFWIFSFLDQNLLIFHQFSFLWTGRLLREPIFFQQKFSFSSKCEFIEFFLILLNIKIQFKIVNKKFHLFRDAPSFSKFKLPIIFNWKCKLKSFSVHYHHTIGSRR
jgi:hypothetical protein